MEVQLRTRAGSAVLFFLIMSGCAPAAPAPVAVPSAPQGVLVEMASELDTLALASLYTDQGSHPLVRIGSTIFLPSEECRATRRVGGMGEDRSVGGMAEDRTTGGATEDRTAGGATQDRTTGGATQDRTTGGATQDRTTGGATQDRTTGGATQDRTTGGATQDRTTGGATQDRTTGGAVEDRTTGGAAEDRTTGGAVQDRDLGGAAEVLRCRLSEDRAALILLNVRAPEVSYFDGSEWRPVVSGRIPF